ncbi:MAG: tRNA (adenosine(37)-N6)-threonylcarbamoyltransferase complex transferase subunit TsaD [Bacteroides sp.]|nr:tRNA (adenosine(37)-N6)-threonylcarbamoyltransferase complex transferase subunit TsaD [Eubacterium sp.]MCM1418430.1 tRNA (adenosine(37)-N6)-threonylcarbamoyltransferase complex transferase subunit TsaD [Roseburia sp.]MCM1461549.1 tRNA (adenosine(37)-N6)-threonylcarbamoyltransferase complex transferase subunit TsaD [Bacteroides sp.]
MKILAIESSCDETAAAVVEDGRRIVSNVVATQIEEHRLYGGVVPEIASRRHCESITAVVDEALARAGLSLAETDAVAVTYAPGLIGALLVGVNFAKGLSLASGKPLVPVHHIKGHIAANYLEYPELEPPYLCLVASGGHSHIVRVEGYTRFTTIGRTLDDAAGEAFDKAARAMGFPYPGGVEIDRAAKDGDPRKYRLPRPKTANPYDFSFSGLKTNVINLVHNAAQRGKALDLPSLAASFQYTVADILTSRFIAAAQDLGAKTAALAGGVAANSALREMLAERCEKRGIRLYVPPIALCGDNAAMIGSQAYYEYQAGNVADGGLNAMATCPL